MAGMSAEEQRWGIGEPKLRTADIVVWLYKNMPERFTVRDIVQNYGILRGEAQRRVNYMIHAWGAARCVGEARAHRVGRRARVYALTDWGLRYGKGRVETKDEPEPEPKPKPKPEPKSKPKKRKALRPKKGS